MKHLIFIFSLILFVFPSYKKATPVYEGIYTDTGYGKDENDQPISVQYSYSYYVKIYNDSLVVTTVEFGTGKIIDLKYLFSGKDDEGNKIYTKDRMNSYLMDENYDLMRVLSTPIYIYGNNVWRSTYWEIVKGEKYQYYNQMHREDGSANQIPGGPIDDEDIDDILFRNGIEPVEF